MELKRKVRRLAELGTGLTAIAALMVACGGGSSGSSGGASGGAATTSATITPFKGPFSSGATITIRDANGNLVSLLSGGEINASGVANVTYSAGVAYPLIVEVAGSYYNENTGAVETATAPLRGIISGAGATANVPVTIVTEAAVADLQNRLGSFAPAHPVLAASAVAALNAAGAMLGIPASAVPSFDPANRRTSDPDTLRLAAWAMAANGQTGATLVDRVRTLAASLAALNPASAPVNVISQAAYNIALNAVTSGASSVMATGASAPVPPAIPTASFAALYASAVAAARAEAGNGGGASGGSGGGTASSCTNPLGSGMFRIISINGVSITGGNTLPPVATGAQISIGISTLTTAAPSLYSIAFNSATAPLVVQPNSVDIATNSLRVTIPQGATGGVRITDNCTTDSTYYSAGPVIAAPPSNTTGGATPTITGFSPASGATGATVTITGTNLGNFIPAPLVKFGTTTAQGPGAMGAYIWGGTTSLQVAVPTGLAAGNHTITIGGMSGTPMAVGTFSVTGAGGGGGAGVTLSPAFNSVNAITNATPSYAILGGVTLLTYDGPGGLLLSHQTVAGVEGLQVNVGPLSAASSLNNGGYSLTPATCALAANIYGAPLCTSLGITFNRAAGTVSFSNTPMANGIYGTAPTVFTLNGSLTFAPF